MHQEEKHGGQGTEGKNQRGLGVAVRGRTDSIVWEGGNRRNAKRTGTVRKGITNRPRCQTEKKTQRIRGEREKLKEEQRFFSPDFHKGPRFLKSFQSGEDFIDFESGKNNQEAFLDGEDWKVHHIGHSGHKKKNSRDQRGICLKLPFRKKKSWEGT